MTAETHEPKKRGRPKGSSKLTIKQQKFITAFLATGNAAEAYRKAYNAKNMAETTIYGESQKLLRHPLISTHLLSAQKRASERAEITALDLVNELADIQKLAVSDGQYAPAVAAIVAKAKILGKITNRTAVEGQVDHNHSHAHSHVHRELSESDRWLEDIGRPGRTESAAKALGLN